MRLLALILCLGATPASADFCADLWFTRNLIMDRAGYCFGSVLGRAMFDNDACIGKSVTPSPADQRLVRTIREREQEFGCKVDTSSPHLDLRDARHRRLMTTLPVRDALASGCIGWLDPVAPLHAGASTASAPVGRIEPGDDVLFEHDGVSGWSYVTVRASGWGRLKSAGWLREDLGRLNCRQFAG